MTSLVNAMFNRPTINHPTINHRRANRSSAIVRTLLLALVMGLASACATTDPTAPRSDVLSDSNVDQAIHTMLRWEQESVKLDRSTAGFVAALKQRPLNRQRLQQTWAAMQEQAESARVARKHALLTAKPIVDEAKRRMEADGEQAITPKVAQLASTYQRAKTAFDGALDRHVRVVRAVKKLASK